MLVELFGLKKKKKLKFPLTNPFFSRYVTVNTPEPRHDKTCLREFPTTPDTNQPVQPQTSLRSHRS